MPPLAGYLLEGLHGLLDNFGFSPFARFHACDRSLIRPGWGASLFFSLVGGGQDVFGDILSPEASCKFTAPDHHDLVTDLLGKPTRESFGNLLFPLEPQSWGSFDEVPSTFDFHRLTPSWVAGLSAHEGLVICLFF